MKSVYRNPVKEMGEEGFFDVMSEINSNLLRITKTYAGSYPFANIAQRRFASVGAKPTVDGKMDFDLRTAFPGPKGQKVKVQREWLQAMYSMIINKHSNMDWDVGV
ncbi:hypothetical protein [Pseudohalioglobus lutimaris]|nr:hypothetical protein [Pseudohalioglobus lutimaris]